MVSNTFEPLVANRLPFLRSCCEFFNREPWVLSVEQQRRLFLLSAEAQSIFISVQCPSCERILPQLYFRTAQQPADFIIYGCCSPCATVWGQILSTAASVRQSLTPSQAANAFVTSHFAQLTAAAYTDQWLRCCMCTCAFRPAIALSTPEAVTGYLLWGRCPECQR